MAGDLTRKILADIEINTNQSSINASVEGVDRVSDALLRSATAYKTTVQSIEEARLASQAFLDEAQQLVSMTSEYLGVNEQQAQAINESAQAFRDENEAIQQVNTSVGSQIEQINTLADAFREETAAIKDLDAAGTQLYNGEYGPGAQHVGYGTEGGMIGPAEDDGGGGGGLGNPLALGRGARAAGGLARMAGLGGLANPLTAGADVLFVARGAQELEGVLPAIGAGFVALDAAILPVTIAITAVVGVLGILSSLQDQYNAKLKEQEDQLKALLAAQEQYFEDVGNATTAQAQQRAQEAGQKAAGEGQFIDEIKKQIEESDQAKYQEAQHPYLLQQSQDERLKNLRELEPTLKPLFDQLDKTKEAYQTNIDKLKLYTQGIQDNAFASGDAVEKEKQLQDARDKTAERSIAIAKQDAGLKDTGTPESVQKLIDSLKADRDEVTRQIDDSYKGINKLSADEIAKLNDQRKADVEQMQDLEKNILPVVRARAQENEELKKNQERIKEIASDQAALHDIEDKQTQDKIAYLKQQSDAETKAQQQRDDAMVEEYQKQHDLLTERGRKEEDIVRETTDKIADIRLKEDEKELSIYNSYSDKMADLHQKERDDQEKLAQQYYNGLQTDQQQEQNKLRDLVQSEQNKEVKDKLDHEQRLADIRRSALQDEQDALLNGNFEQLYIDQQHEKNKETDEDVRYNNQLQQERLQLQQQQDQEIQHYQDSQNLAALHYQQQLQLEQTALQQQEQQAATDYDRKLRDARLAEEQDIEQANRAEERKERDLQIWYDRQQQDLVQAEGLKLRQIDTNLGRELQLYQENFNARMQILYQERQQLQQALAGQGASAPGPYQGQASLTEYGSGGDFPGNKPFRMSERGVDETLSIAGRSYKVGGGAAIVYPSQGGTVSQTSGGNHIENFNPVINLNGAYDDPAANAQAIKDQMASMLEDWAA